MTNISNPNVKRMMVTLTKLKGKSDMPYILQYYWDDTDNKEIDVKSYGSNKNNKKLYLSPKSSVLKTYPKRGKKMALVFLYFSSTD